MEWQCGVCKKNLHCGRAQCYRDKKYCWGCMEKIIEIDENMELYKIIETSWVKRAQMKERIDAKYRQDDMIVLSTPLSIQTELAGLEDEEAEELKEEPKELKEEAKELKEELKEEPKELKEEPKELKEEPKELKEEAADPWQNMITTPPDWLKVLLHLE